MSMITNPPKFLYRLFNGPAYEGRAHIDIERFSVVKVTDCGVWINLDEGTRRKFVLLQDWRGRPTHKRWACPTKEEALESFKRRKAMQIARAEQTVRNARAALAIASEPGFEPSVSTWFNVPDEDPAIF